MAVYRVTPKSKNKCKQRQAYISLAGPSERDVEGAGIYNGNATETSHSQQNGKVDNRK